MTGATKWTDRWSASAEALDARLLAVSRRAQLTIIALTILLIVAVGLTNVPRSYIDYTGLPLLGRISQFAGYGTDTIADVYESKVILHDVRDMYTKTGVAQTPLEARTWTKEASSPYPPAVLLAIAGLCAVGERIGVGLYGMILGVATFFVAASAIYSLRTRWYLFPLIWTNVVYFAHRFVYVQDDSYLVMLAFVMTALLLGRARRPAAHTLMAVAIVLKLSPLYYVKNLASMSRAAALAFVAILFAGLVLPYFVWSNYLYIFHFHEQVRAGYWTNTAGAGLVVVPFTVVLAYVEARLGFDVEDRIGWSLVPFAMLLALTMNAARHLLVVLLVPDKRVLRNLAGAAGLWLYYPLAAHVRFGAVVYITIGLLLLELLYYLGRIGWKTIRADARHPVLTARLMLGSRA